MDFEGNLHSRELESEIGLTFDTDFQDPEIFILKIQKKYIFFLRCQNTRLEPDGN